MLAIIAIRPMNLRSKIIFRLGGNGSVSFLCVQLFDFIFSSQKNVYNEISTDKCSLLFFEEGEDCVAGID
jgi:hypothetical protein